MRLWFVIIESNTFWEKASPPIESLFLVQSAFSPLKREANRSTTTPSINQTKLTRVDFENGRRKTSWLSEKLLDSGREEKMMITSHVCLLHTCHSYLQNRTDRKFFVQKNSYTGWILHTWPWFSHRRGYKSGKRQNYKESQRLSSSCEQKWQTWLSGISRVGDRSS